MARSRSPAAGRSKGHGSAARSADSLYCGHDLVVLLLFAAACLLGALASDTPLGAQVRAACGFPDRDELELTYFDARGRAEAVRLALKDNGVAFKDTSFTSEQWGKERADGLKANMTAQGLLKFGQVPLLSVGGELHLVQSHSILRYLGRRYGFYHGTAAQLALVDMLSDGTEDARKQLTAIKYSGKSELQKEASYTLHFETESKAPRWLGYYEAAVEQSPTDFVAGTSAISMADYLLYDLLDTHAQLQPQRTEVLLARLPRLSAWRQAIGDRPRLKAYLASPERRK